MKEKQSTTTNKVLMLSREFNRGEPISEYCRDLSEFLASRGWSVDLVCFGDYASDDMVGENFHIHRVQFPVHADNYFNWAMLLNHEFKKRGRELAQLMQGFDIILANDWTSAPAAVSLSQHLEVPSAITMHSTENQRGFAAAHSSIISTVEWFACFELSQVIVSTAWTLESVKHDLGVPEGKILLANPSEFGWENKILDAFERLIREHSGGIGNDSDRSHHHHNNDDDIRSIGGANWQE